mmetsp:Transcript_15708/g.29626  ORF Transcript_15708/g.29626 Transcript_15708/m.29626 type:complete len:341 (-) Transcript_15708:128-1150(-)|eukprot:CAMPEP_0176501816 /NCGR_PEP_ID=MMETSP0200_2-20121128/14388_1 /TAXON_ID=947934 /ORGANISM="Chaetoceros sp., Strain GSL56" /LENGTH=340 /DNA_ID=CAMNT_0017900779 /DNA_START=79 /DNA_END=1101 /DNA_ORIENTATION=-
MKTWHNIYRIVTTLFIVLLWFCLNSRLDWDKDTRKALVKMMGFTAEGDDLPSVTSSTNDTFPLDLVQECEWQVEKFTSLPKPVQRYFHRAFLFTGEKEEFWEECIKIVQSLTCYEEGEVLTNGIWLPFEATRYFSAIPPHAGFVWDAKIKYPTAFELPYDIPYYVRETYANGGYDRTIKIFGALPIFHNANKTHDEEEQAGFRWLAFSPIFPTSLLPRETLGVSWLEKQLHHQHQQQKKQFIVPWPFEKKSESTSTVLAEYVNPQGVCSKAEVHFDRHGLIDIISAVGGGGDGWQFHLNDYKNVGYGMLVPTNIQSGRQEHGHFVSHMNIRIQDVKYTYL